MVSYSSQVEQKMQRMYRTLSEKDRRRYAGIEAEKLGHGGIEYISNLLEVDPKTIRVGIAELEMETDPLKGRNRKKRRGT